MCRHYRRQVVQTLQATSDRKPWGRPGIEQGFAKYSELKSASSNRRPTASIQTWTARRPEQQGPESCEWSCPVWGLCLMDMASEHLAASDPLLCPEQHVLG